MLNLAETENEYLSGKAAWQAAERDARLSGRDWVAWLDAEGEPHAAVRSPASLKRAILAVGIKRLAAAHLKIIGGGDGVGELLLDWATATRYLRSSKYLVGLFPAYSCETEAGDLAELEDAI